MSQKYQYNRFIDINGGDIRTLNDIKCIIVPCDGKNERILSAFAINSKAEILYYHNEEEINYFIDQFKHYGIKSKEVIILKKFLGRFVQKCPGSPNVICCNYIVINTCFNCLYDCSYCFLRSYLNAFGIIQFINIDDLKKEVDNYFRTTSSKMIYRVGTGEFTDSLMFDNVTQIGNDLIAIASRYQHIMLELKTKSGNVDHLLEIPNKGNTVLSWSITTERNICKYEQGTAVLQERLFAIRKASQAGFFIAVHFDPIILYDGWESEYNHLIEILFENVNPDHIAWISLGGFRYTPAFKDVLKEIEPNEDMTLHEMFPGIDGKYRYFKPIRIEMYKFLLDRIRKFTAKPFIYLCMESSDVWEQVFGKRYTSSEELELDFSFAMKKFLNDKAQLK